MYAKATKNLPLSCFIIHQLELSKKYEILIVPTLSLQPEEDLICLLVNRIAHVRFRM